MKQTDITSRLQAVEEFCARIQSGPDIDASELTKEIGDLAALVDVSHRELQALDQLAANVGRGVLLDDVLNDIYDGFRDVIPYDRIGFSLIEDGFVTAAWARTESESIQLTTGYSARLEQTSLGRILEERRPRIINDLRAYAAEHPDSETTRLIVQEGVQSSLTCPLFIDGGAVGFLFFSSFESFAYSDIHTRTFDRIADQLAGVIEKGRLTSQLADRAEAIERQNHELRSLNEMKNTFIGMAGHDLRSPLATIQMTADLLDNADYLSLDERKTLIRDIREQADYMLALVNELLDMAQIDSGKLELRRQRVNLETLVTSAVERHGYLGARKNIRVVLSKSATVEVDADATRIRQVIDNLLSNAVKYSPIGSLVSVELATADDHVRVAVRDAGPGIAPGDRGRLFEQFETTGARPTGGESSIGLGLAIAKRIIIAHGGTIDVESTLGRGSTFWFKLPLA